MDEFWRSTNRLLQFNALSSTQLSSAAGLIRDQINATAAQCALYLIVCVEKLMEQFFSPCCFKETRNNWKFQSNWGQRRRTEDVFTETDNVWLFAQTDTVTVYYGRKEAHVGLLERQMHFHVFQHLAGIRLRFYCIGFWGWKLHECIYNQLFLDQIHIMHEVTCRWSQTWPDI